MIESCEGNDVLVTGLLSSDEAFIAFITIHSTTTAGSIVIKDSIDNTGNIIFKFNSGINEVSTFCSFNVPLRAQVGIYVELTDVTATIGLFG